MQGILCRMRLLPVLNLHEKIGGLFTDKGDRMENVQNLTGTAFAKNPAEGVRGLERISLT